MHTKIGVAQSVFVVALLAKQEDHKPLKSHTLSAILRVSDSYLKKITRRLVVAGILDSSASKTGGLTLKRPAEQITLLDIYSAIEDDKSFFNYFPIMQSFEKFHDKYLIEKGNHAIAFFQEAEELYKSQLAAHTIADILDLENDTLSFDFNKLSLLDIIQGNPLKALPEQ